MLAKGDNPGRKAEFSGVFALSFREGTPPK